MRPIRLRVQALGPFTGSEDVNLESLSRRGFFLIHGSTGSGKTFLLDALSLALYGKPCFDGRTAAGLRSQRAPADRPTEVELLFGLGQQQYRVLRRPAQERPKRRGEGLVRTPPRATLWRLDPQGERVLADRDAAVTEHVERLLGMAHPEFLQVVLIPQGRFRRLLTARSTDRQAILQTLFGTDWYRQIQEFLREELRGLEGQITDRRRRQELLREQVGADSEPRLRELLDAADRSKKQREQELAEALIRAEQARTRLDEGRRIQELLDERERARGEMERLQDRQAETEARRLELEAARRAAPVLPTEAARQDLERRAREAAENREACLRALEKAMQRETETGQRLRAEQDRESEREAARQRALRLETMAEAAEALEDLRSRQRERRRAAEDAVRTEQVLVEREAGLRTEIQRLEDERRSLQPRAGSEELRSRELKEAERALKAHRERERREEQHRSAQDRSREADRILGHLTARSEDLERLHRELRHSRDRNRAAYLAAELVPGEPCPVCGSREHPQIAVSPEDAPSDAEITELETQIEQQRRELGAARDAARQAAGEAAAAEAAMDEQSRSLGSRLDRSREELETDLQDARRRMQEAREASENLTALVGRDSAARKELQDLTPRLMQARDAVRQAAGEAAAQDGLVRERQAELVRELGETATQKDASAAVQAALHEARELRQSLEQALEHRREEASRARERRVQDEAALEGSEATVRDVEERLERAREDLRKALVEARFDSVDALRHARRIPAELDALEAAVRRDEAERTRVLDRLERAEQAARDRSPADLDSLEVAARAAEDDRAQAERELARCIDRAHRIREVRDRVSDLDRRIQGQETRYEDLARLSETAAGRNPLRTSLEGFVLAARLDEVTAVASRRLLRMSRGRYRLHRPRQPVDLRSAGGLELEVFDAHTGKLRPAATLSGGESFLAALSLALGLSDVVQARSGGIHLETVFVDEGFGTLDPESLDWALATLMELGTEGRAVGVISHVPELRERIEDRLEVIQDRTGSRTRAHG